MENEIFKSARPDQKKLLSYGFTRDGGLCSYTTDIDGGHMALTVYVEEGRVRTAVFDRDCGEEYVLYRVAGAQGTYIGKVREEIKGILEDICEACFYTQSFFVSATQSLFAYCREKYGDMPEYLFEGSPDCAVFRRKDSQKWYAAVMKIPRARLSLPGEGTVEIVNLHAKAEDVPSLIDKRSIFPAYHMNKKHWITVLLDGGISEQLLFSLIDISYLLGDGKQKKKRS